MAGGTTRSRASRGMPEHLPQPPPTRSRASRPPTLGGRLSWFLNKLAKNRKNTTSGTARTPRSRASLPQQPPRGRLSSQAGVFVRCVIDRLRLLWKYLRGLARQRRGTVVPVPVSDPAKEDPTPGLHRRHHFKPERLRRLVLPPSVEPFHPPTPPAPVVMIDGQLVPREIEERYRQYCNLSTLIDKNSVLCHMCFFEIQRHENCTVLKSKILWHCSEKHSIGIECKYPGCKVRLPTESDRNLHMYFCH